MCLCWLVRTISRISDVAIRAQFGRGYVSPPDKVVSKIVRLFAELSLECCL
jgi:hypothetical protein